MTDVIGTRIDRGVKRGPKPARNAVTVSPKADLGSWQIPPDLNPHEVLQRYLTEATTSQIAGQYGLSRKALVKWLRSTVPTEWKEIQLIRAHANLEQGEDGIEDAEASQSAISLACTRERIKAAQWRLQSLDKDYHPKQEITHNIQPVLTINIAALPQPSPIIDLPTSAVQHIPSSTENT